MLVQHLVLVTLHCGVQLVLSETIRIGDTKYHIQCSCSYFKVLASHSFKPMQPKNLL